MYFDNMVLYYKPTCPFCHRVLAFMEEEDIAMPMRDTLEPGVKDDLVRIRRYHPLPRRPHLGARRGLTASGPLSHQSIELVSTVHTQLLIDALGVRFQCSPRNAKLALDGRWTLSQGD